MEIVSAKYLLTLNNSDEPIEDGAMAIELGEIHAVGTREELKAKYPDAQEIDHSKQVVMPGLVNAHAQLDLTGYYSQRSGQLGGASSQPDFIDWLIGSMDYRNNAPTTEIIANIQKGTQLLLDAGTTTIGDNTTFEGSYNILDEMGIRAIIFSEIYSGKSESAQDLFENALAIAEKYYNPSKDARINVGLAPTAPYLLSKNLLRIISQHAQEAEVPLKISAAESFAEMEFFFDSQGIIGEKLFPAVGWTGELPPAHQKTPVKFLDEIGFLAASPSVIGCTHLSENCFKYLARNMCRVIFCPTLNSYFGHGQFPVSKLQKHGIPIALGTGALHKAGGLSLWDEMKEILKVTPGNPSPKEIIQMATVGGARSLGLENQIGTLVKGKQADYIVVDLPPGHEIDKSYIYGALIRNTTQLNVKKTVVAGEVLKSI